MLRGDREIQPNRSKENLSRKLPRPKGWRLAAPEGHGSSRPCGCRFSLEFDEVGLSDPSIAERLGQSVNHNFRFRPIQLSGAGGLLRPSGPAQKPHEDIRQRRPPSIEAARSSRSNASGGGRSPTRRPENPLKTALPTQVPRCSGSTTALNTPPAGSEKEVFTVEHQLSGSL